MLIHNNQSTQFSPFLLSRSLSLCLSLSLPFTVPFPSLLSPLLPRNIAAFKMLPPFATNNTYFQMATVLEGTGATGHAGFSFIKGPAAGHCSDCSIEVSLKTSSFPFFIFTATQQDSFKV